MVYMGSKNKYAPEIVPILQKIINDNKLDTYIEPFVGGANVIDKIQYKNKFGYDKNATLIALHKQAQEDFSIIPEHGSRDWWDEAKSIYRAAAGDIKKLNESSMPLWKIGAIAFFGSFSRGGFSRGMAKNQPGHDYYNEAYKNMQKQSARPLYHDITFAQAEYNEIKYQGALIYNDPPYQNTKAYGYKFETGFDYDAYWNWVREQSKTNYVVCSEQTFPEDFIIIWERSVKRTNGKDNNFEAVEKLGIWKDGLAAKYFKN